MCSILDGKFVTDDSHNHKVALGLFNEKSENVVAGSDQTEKKESKEEDGLQRGHDDPQKFVSDAINTTGSTMSPHSSVESLQTEEPIHANDSFHVSKDFKPHLKKCLCGRDR